jgi:hypothetical protein
MGRAVRVVALSALFNDTQAAALVWFAMPWIRMDRGRS